MLLYNLRGRNHGETTDKLWKQQKETAARADMAYRELIKEYNPSVQRCFESVIVMTQPIA